jgi:hypothetical protein
MFVVDAVDVCGRVSIVVNGDFVGASWSMETGTGVGCLSSAGVMINCSAALSVASTICIQSKQHALSHDA